MSFVACYKTSSAAETHALGVQLASVLPERGVVLLKGELGAGKTTLTKGIVEGRGAAPADEVSSPTFTIIHEYGEPVSVYHIDLYRLDTLEEAQHLGLEDIFEQTALVLMEWGEKFPALLPLEYGEIAIEHSVDDERQFTYSTITNKHKNSGG